MPWARLGIGIEQSPGLGHFSYCDRGLFVGQIGSPGLRIVDPLARQNVCDGQQLDPRVLSPGRVIEAGRGRFGAHLLGRLLKAQQDANFGFFPLTNAAQISDIRRFQLPALDRKNDGPGLLAAVMEVKPAIDPLVGPLLLIHRPRSHQAQRPPLELVLVGRGQRGGIFRRGGLADHLIASQIPEGITKAGLDQSNREMGDIDADPLPAELLGSLDGRAAAAEGIEDDVAFVAAGFDDAFKQGDGFLGR